VVWFSYDKNTVLMESCEVLVVVSGVVG